MYEITIDNDKADIMPGEAVVLERYNPLFDFETIQGSRVNDFTLPFSPKNDRIFGFLSLPQTRFTKKNYYCEKKADGLVVERGFVDIYDLSEEGYVCTFTQNLSEFWGDYQNILLNKLPLGGEAIPVAPVKAANHLTDTYCWPTVLNAQFYGTEVQAGYNGKMNEWVGSVLNAHARVPMLFVRWVFEALSELCDFTYTGNFFDSDEFKRGVVFNTFSIDDATTIEYANHLPELTVIDWFIQLRKLYNLRVGVNVQTRVVQMDFADPFYARSAKLDWTTKAKPNKSRSILRANRLQLDWELDGGDEFMKVIPDDFLYCQTPGTGSFFPVVTKFSSCLKDAATGFAKISQQGVTPRFGQGNQKFAPRLLLWNGNGVATNEYGTTRLAWHGANNLVDKFWKNFQAFLLNTVKKTMSINLNAGDIAAINWHETSAAENVTYVKGKEYIIANLKVILPLEGVAEIEVWERNL